MISSEYANAIGDDILAIDWVERFGGMTCLAKNNDGVIVPVSEHIDVVKCFDTNHYKENIPDAQYKGFVYLEEAGDSTTKDSVAGLKTYIQPIRMIAWINYPKAGFANTSVLPFRPLMKIAASVLVSIGDGISGSHISGLKVLTKDNVRRLFDRYNYGPDTHPLLSWPYGAFVMEYNLHGTINIDCLPENAGGPEIECT